MGHLGQCGLSSLAMCTRSAMWIRSDYVPRETRCGVWRGGGGVGKVVLEVGRRTEGFKVESGRELKKGCLVTREKL